MKHVLHPQTAVTAKGDLPSLELVQVMQAQVRIMAANTASIDALTTALGGALSRLEAAEDEIATLNARVAALEAP